MNEKKILTGAIIWFMGLLLPVMHHTLIVYAAIQETGYTYSYHNMMRYFFSIPWIELCYLAAMALVGLCVIMSGFKNHREMP